MGGNHQPDKKKVHARPKEDPKSAIAAVLRSNKALLTSASGGVHMVHKGNSFSISFRDLEGHTHSVNATVSAGPDKRPSWKIDSAEGAGVGSGKSVVPETEVAAAMKRIFDKAKASGRLEDETNSAANSGIDFTGESEKKQEKNKVEKSAGGSTDDRGRDLGGPPTNRIVEWLDNDLEKSHVKAHFRRNEHGRLEFIKDYDDARHAREVIATFNKGDKVRVNNPKSKHHGKEMEVHSYSDKYHRVRGKIEGYDGQVDFEPDQFEFMPAEGRAPSEGATKALGASKGEGRGEDTPPAGKEGSKGAGSASGKVLNATKKIEELVAKRRAEAAHKDNELERRLARTTRANEDSKEAVESADPGDHLSAARLHWGASTHHEEQGDQELAVAHAEASRAHHEAARAQREGKEGDGSRMRKAFYVLDLEKAHIKVAQ